MSFFYDLNKKLDSIRATPEVTHQQLNERDMGKHNNATTGFAALAKKAGGGEKGEKIAGAQFQKMKKAGQLEEEEGMSRAAKGYEKYGKQGMEALAKAGRDGKALDPVRKKYDKYDNEQVDEKVEIYTRGADADWASMSRSAKNPNDPGAVAHRKSAADAARAARTGGDLKFKGQSQVTDIATTGQGAKVHATRSPKDVQEGGSYLNYADSAAENPAPPKKPMAAPAPKPQGVMDKVKSIGNKVAGGINKLVGHGSDEEMRKDLQRKSGAPVTGKKPAVAPMHPSDEYDYFTGRDKVRGGEQQVKEKMSPAKQKSFAALAPPTDKITFADKIAGAKKEVDEMLGQVAADAMRSAVGKSSEQRAQQQDDDFVNDHYAKARNNRRVDAEDQWARSKGRNPGAEMDEERSKGTAFDMSTPRVDTPKAGSTERGAKHDITHSTSDPRYKGRTVIRRTDAQGNSVGADDDSDTQAGPRGRGRPKGTKGAIGAKGPSGRSKLMTKEGSDQGQAQQVVNDLAELRAIAKQSQRGGQFPQGFASQLEVVLYAAITLIRNQQPGDAQVREEEKTSTRDDHAEKAGKKVAKDIEYDEKKKDNIHGKKRGPEDAKAEKAGKKVAKDIEHDEKKKKEEEVDESTTAGSVATSTATKSSKGSMVGKGIYDSMNRELENMIAESMTINMSDSTEGNKSLSVTATDDDAMKLAMILKSAGLGGGDAHGGDMHSHGEEPCATCGMPDCGCGDVQEAVDENSPDYPTNTEQANNNFGYADGLDGPKSTGQSTVPVLASQDERQHSYAAEEEDAIKRMMEMAGLAEGNMPMVKKDGKMVPAFATDGKGKNDLEAKDKEEDTVEESIRRMMEIAGIKEAKKQVDQNGDGKNDFEDIKIARMKASGAIKDKEEKKVDESIFALTNQWQAYKG